MGAQRHTLVGVFLISFATLLLELSLTRVLSVTLWYHFGFLVISTALLGFGAAGVSLATWDGLRDRAPLDQALAALSIAFGAVTIASFWLMQRIPFDPFNLLADRRQLVFMPLYYLLLAAPFYCSGLAIALVLTRNPRDINRLYAFDLLGAGAGCGAIALAMPALGGPGSVVLATTVGFLAAVAFGWDTSRALSTIGVAGFAATAVLAPMASRFLPLAFVHGRIRSGPPPIYTAWNTFSRVDVYEYPGDRPGLDPADRVIVIDGGSAATDLHDMRPSVQQALARPPDSTDFDSGIAYAGRRQPRLLIIGSGAGQEVFDGLRYGASSITAVEINPIIVDVVTHRMHDFWGDLFDHPGVHLYTGEGRNFVRRSRAQYDAIVSVHTITNAAVASGALSLLENYVLTREAFEDYWEHLSPDGIIFLTRPEAQIARLFATARAVLAAHGVDRPAAHVVAFRQRPTDPADIGRPSFVAGFLLRKSAFTPAQVDAIAAQLHASVGGVGPNHVEMLYTPFGIGANTVYDSLLTVPDVETVYQRTPFELRPATDDRPFFNQNMRWASIDLHTVRDVFTQHHTGRLTLEDRPVAEVTLLVLLVQSIAIAAVLILLPLTALTRGGLRVRDAWRYLVYFGALGLGFVGIEMALLQRFSLFLGQPVYALAVVLAALLTTTGLGSAVASRLTDAPAASLRWMLPSVVGVLILTALVTPAVFAAGLGDPLWVRVVIAALLVAPVGTVLGMPFPTGLRLVSSSAPCVVSWAWGVNGFFTVIGSAAAVILGMAVGFRGVLAAAGACYLLALAMVAGVREPTGTGGSSVAPDHGPIVASNV